MGKAHGFFGPNGIAFVVMIAVIQKIKPIMFLHENTRSFDFSMLAFLLSDSYQLHHTFLKPEDFGCPAKRTRSYSALIRKDHDLEHGLDEMFRMTTLTHEQLDCGAFLLAPAEEACRSALAQGAGCVFVQMCVCVFVGTVCVYVRERERESDRE